ncbi:SGNH/GDSL hydrolase family protein [Aquabacterium sp.]|uniref:SGNH/GDSL hydrolase family protein n=1 Tax=Aquabacterium sp. TaxID=1872578 RepID=UPI0025BC0A07|nr:SGNH/GDSL hydrolase family protein [Aquabacterium sp.]
MSRSFAFLSSSKLRRAGVVAAACAVALATSVAVTGCGGGTQSKKFVPTKILSFGDDTSYLNSTGQSYTVNSVSINSSGAALKSDGTTVTDTPSEMVYYCQNYPIWVQSVAAYYGFDGEQCPISGASRKAFFLANDPGTVATDASGAINATNAATAATNAGVAKVIQTINANLGNMDKNTMVLVLAGQPDVLKAYADYLAGADASTLKSNLTALGASLVDNALVAVGNTGARIVLLRIPKLRLSPLGLAGTSTTSGNGGDTDQGVLDALAYAFNEGMTNEAERKFDGRQLGLVRADDLTQTLVTYGSSTYSLTNVTTPACTTALASLTAPLCNSSYVSGNTSGMASSTGGSAFLWADYTHFAPAGHTRLYNLVMTRIAAQPF